MVMLNSQHKKKFDIYNRHLLILCNRDKRRHQLTCVMVYFLVLSLAALVEYSPVSGEEIAGSQTMINFIVSLIGLYLVSGYMIFHKPFRKTFRNSISLHEIRTLDVQRRKEDNYIVSLHLGNGTVRKIHLNNLGLISLLEQLSLELPRIRHATFNSTFDLLNEN